MRDPSRIPKVLAAVKELWDANPDMRLGQLVCNATSVASRQNRYAPHRLVEFFDVFNVEDDKLLEALDKLS